MKSKGDCSICSRLPSHPARGAWIEIHMAPRKHGGFAVAPRKGCVD